MESRILKTSYANSNVLRFYREMPFNYGETAEDEAQDLFSYSPVHKYDVVSSQGVLHHTDNCYEALRKVLRDFLRNGGHALIGLYHKHGRRPFLEHFAKLRASGKKEDELFAEYKRMNAPAHDKARLQSWFRDQVLHPHETQHTLAEFLPLIAEEGCRLTATSINRFAPIDDLDAVLALEPGFEAIGRERLAQGRYYTGYFIFIVQKLR